ncbi:2-oxoacid:ferredoxin oxidoreductase subunit gamma [Candidatus Bathyarchaeota archaeon]|nr:MAG: 2-oxoacid:ferredoxin oxidoreductase subunit gamma [Candidatus Bathyarchaeota archaeon]
MKVEIRIAGFGGQGIIRSGLMLAMASCVFENKNAVQTQSYGPESRGGRCKSEVIISDEEIDYPLVQRPDILIVMSQEAYNEYADAIKEGGILLVDPDMVPERRDIPNVRIYEIPATRIAEELGKKIVANVVMLGAFTAITKLVDPEAMRQSILRNIPKGTEKLNLMAFERGLEYGKAIVSM